MFDAVREWWATGRAAEARDALTDPQTFSEWADHYARRETAYRGGLYDRAQRSAWRLFEARDPSGELIAETRRLTRDVQHVVDVDAAALASRWTLEPEGDGTDAIAEAGLGVWRRSGVQARRSQWARIGASLGDHHLEAVRMGPGDVRLVAYDPRFVLVEYDEATGTQIERVIVQMAVMDAAQVSGGRIVEAATVSTTMRVLDRETVQVWENGRLLSEAPHGLDVVPWVHLPFLPYTDPSHGMWAAPGLDGALAAVDSILAAVQAVGNRHGAPILHMGGARLDASGDSIFQPGRVLSTPSGVSAQYLEATLTGLDSLLASAQQARAQARETLPEFLFVEAGANASGAALSMRAVQFVAKMEEVRERWFSGVARATEMAIAMQGGPRLEDAPRLAITAPPVLPADASAEATTVRELYEGGFLLLDDAVQALQRLGFVPPDVDPAEYAERLRERGRAEREAETEAVRAIADAASPRPRVTAEGETLG